jgi:hypothetical protein
MSRRLGILGQSAWLCRSHGPPPGGSRYQASLVGSLTGELGTALRKLGFKRERRWHGGSGFQALWRKQV